MTSVIVVVALMLSVSVNVWLVMRRRAVPQRRLFSSSMLKEVQNISDLVTARQNFQSVVTFADDTKMPYIGLTIPGTSRGFMLIYAGTIACGCDMSKAEATEIPGERKVIITIPHSRITECSADVSKVEVYSQSSGLFKSLKLEDQNREIAIDLERKRDALRGELTAQADKNAVRVLESLVRAMGLEADVHFTDMPDDSALTADTVEAIEAEAAEQCVESDIAAPAQLCAPMESVVIDTAAAELSECEAVS